MSILLNCQSISKSFASQKLFTDITIGFHEGERCGLVGPNGSGKSTLLKILAGLENVNGGEVSLKKDVKVVYLQQQDAFDSEETVETILFSAVEQATSDETEKYRRVHRAIKRGGFENEEQKAATLSGGWRKRLSIISALLKEPDILLMDEPTNHLDLEGILWLEDLLSSASFAFVVVSHDRYFLENVTNRMIEINPCYPEGFLRVDGSYSIFLDEKEVFLAHQAKLESTLANKMRRETEWLQRGPKARTTKARSRIDSAALLKQHLQEVRSRNLQGRKVDIDFDATDRKTRKLIKTESLGKSMGGRKLFEKIDLTLSPGVRLGIMGRNGTGKSTLMSILQGSLKADEGRIEFADDLKIVYFDQKREELNQETTLRRALAPEGDSVVYRGRQIHVASWAKRFLFNSQELEIPVRKLSGGERARVLIARLMLQAADVLLLDEPTNDLDIPSLEVLEESLAEFPGAVVIVSHDRCLIDGLCNRVLGLDIQGQARFFVDYPQWEAAAYAPKEAVTTSKKGEQDRSRPQGKKLSYKENFELGQMEQNIEKAEALIEELQQKLCEETIASNPELLQEYCTKLQEAQHRVESLYKRWEELEEMKKG